MTEFEGQVLAELRVLQSQMKVLLGDSQPGRLTQLEGRVDRHEQTVQRLKGLVGAFGGVLTLMHLVIDYVKR
jgi:hypothetical protein